MLPKLESCKSCLGYQWGCNGFVPASGTGSNGVLIIAEAAGENEAQEGAPLIGKAGHYLFQQLARVGIERDGFRIHNILSCRPPENKLAGMPYEKSVIASCRPNIEATISDMRSRCKRNLRQFVIVTLGRVAFKSVMDLEEKSPLLKADYQGYPLWSERYQAWVLAADHPSYLMRGNHHLSPILQFVFRRALEIAKDGLKLEKHDSYLLDPLPVHFTEWAHEYLRNPGEFPLSYDIETPFKQGEDEEAVSKGEEDEDFSILRVSFCYRPGMAVSVPWTAPYRAAIEAIFASPGPKVGWNSRGYDDERIIAVGIPIHGDRLDGMLAWHVLNSALPKGLGFVTPFYWQNTAMWKHLSSQSPAFYNAKDADACLRNWIGIEKDLKANSQWEVFDRHVIKLNRVFDYMSSKGVLRDEDLRSSAETTLTGLLAETEANIQSIIPADARRIAHVYKTEPKDLTGLLSRPGYRPSSVCSICGNRKPKKDHFKRFVKKVNPCAEGEALYLDEPVNEYYRLAEWKISKQSLLDYQRVVRHHAIYDRRERKVTFNENALIKLQKKYPNDKLYPLILDFRGNQKLLSTYIGITLGGHVRGGMPIGPDGRIHTSFTTDASTLRSTSRRPNLQNLPRPKGPNDLATIIRNLIVAAPGHIFTARDYSGIEAVLVGYEAGLPDYIRLAKMDVHSFYTAYALNALDGRVGGNELPLLSWDDAKLAASLADIKSRFKHDRNSLYKHLVHGANFYQGAKGAQEKILNETGIAFPVPLVQRVMDIYFELFPGIRRWHHDEMLRAERDGFTRNAFGYVHRFSKVFEYEPDGSGGWHKEPGPQANQVIAFKPQSNAAGIIKEAMMRLWYDRWEEAGQFLRLLVHDELFCEVPINDQEKIDQILKEEMEKPIPELALPASWNLGESLVILTEPKTGPRWGQMH